MDIAVLGYGTVGSGVVDVISLNQKLINTKAGQEINIKYILDKKEFPGTPIEKLLVHDVDIIMNDPDIKVVVEVMGGVEPAFTFAKKALANGKSVVTSNKELVAKHGAELLEIAKENRLNFLFEASVGGGIPIIRPLNQSLTADEISEITGILNGTTNYILTKMSREGANFEDVLKEAQKMGYAERNPEADVEGYDACRKIAILSSLAYGSQVDYEDIYTEGITKITARDFAYAAKINRSIKLLGMSRKKNGTVYAMVAPFMVSEEDSLYNVNDVINGISIKGNAIGDVLFVGAGAGKMPTASAVVTDVVDCAKHLGTNIMTFWEEKKIELGNVDDMSSQFYIRISGNADERLPEVRKVFGDIKDIILGGVDDEFAVVTPEMTEKEYNAAAAKLDGIESRIRLK